MLSIKYVSEMKSMNFKFYGDTQGLLDGIGILSKELNFNISEDGLPVKVYKTDKNIEVELDNGEASIGFSEKIHFFRALGLLIEAAEESKCFQIVEVPQFSSNGPMIDSSRNSVISVKSIKEILTKMSLMGLNLFMLYTEDTFEIENQPYFGYMRGKYTFEELKECDDYADVFGIEMIPCIQTLGHLGQALKWSYADAIKDNQDILLVGEEKTYEFIENMIKSSSKPFRSKRIHIGMDESHWLGLGAYLEINGYRERFSILNEHLARVSEITSKYGLKPMMWSDMYFRLGSKTGDYYDPNAVIPQSAIENSPKDVQLVYWDYYHGDEEFYLDYIKKHKAFDSDLIFAGGIWTWLSLSINYPKTFLTVNAALSACKKEGVKEIIATAWGDNGAETNIFSALLGLQLYAEHGYSRELDMDKLKKRFEFCTNGDFDAFLDISNIDKLPGKDDNPDEIFNPSKYMLWQDILMGLFDKDVEGVDVYGHYSKLEENMKLHATKNKEWSHIFEVQQKLCTVLKSKGDLGNRIREFYEKNDRDALSRIVNDELPQLSNSIKELRLAHRDQWFKTYKSFGWEVLDIRYGGVLAKIETATLRINDYISGKISHIEELEEERLYFDGVKEIEDCKLPVCVQYHRIATSSLI